MRLLVVLLMGLAVNPDEARAAATQAVVEAAKLDSSVFTDAFFGYTSAPFQREWHRKWNRPSARVVQWSPVEHGKTQQVTGLVMHRLGRDPVNARILWIGAAQKVGLKSTGIIKQAIEQPTHFLRAVFPTLRPGRSKWTQSQFTVAGAKVTEKDCSVETAGVETQILGGRFTDIVLDDICTFETTYTAARRQKVVQWLKSTVLGRLLEGGRIVCLGNAWYPDDAMHALERLGYTVIRETAYREADDGRIIPGSILWPAQWSLDRLGEYPDSFRRDGSLSKRRELGAVESMRQLRCIPYSAGQGRFEMKWFDDALTAGDGLTLVDEWREGWPTFMGVDLGVSQKEGADATAFWCMAVHPQNNKRRLLNGFEERLNGPDIVARLKDWNRRYAPVTMVENNAAQDFIRQFAQDAGIPTRPFTTGKNKADPSFGVPSLGVELQQGLWILPSDGEEAIRLATTWRTQCLAYSPGQHTGDLLMASWFAREAARQGGPAASYVHTPDDDGRDSGLHADYGALGRRGRLTGRR